MPFKKKITKKNKEQIDACKLIPSNILKALIKSKKDNTVKKTETLSIFIEL